MAAMGIRADKQARAAMNNFDAWHSQQLSDCPQYLCPIAKSPLVIDRRKCPHSVLFFLIQVLQRLLHQFWPTALSDPYVKRCGTANGRCPPSIIALLFYYECPCMCVSTSVAMPGANKQRIHDSETARAAARAAQSAGSATAASSADAAPETSARDAFWKTFAENVMQHLVWPAVRQGVIRVAPKSDRDNPEWWCEDIVPILEDPEVFLLHSEGGKKMARRSWYHVCEELATYEFPPVVAAEPFTQKTVPEFLADAGYRAVVATKGVAATEQSAGSATAASSGDAAPDTSARDAFWHTFAENVMVHLVWPAVWAGVIRVAPKSDRDNPAWWSEDILPILEDPEVFSLYWQGGKKMARNSWYHVCEELGKYNFPPVGAGEPFTQKTVPEFLADAGYSEVVASEDVAATDPRPAKRSRPSPGVPGGVSGFTAETPAAPAAPCQSKLERARTQADFARRVAYTELDQHARGTIASADWRFLAHVRVGRKISEAFRTYQSTNQFSRELLHPKAVVAELRSTVEYFSEMRLWPRWVLHPNDRVVRSLPEDDAAYEDCGNENWEAVVNLMNLSSVIPTLYGQAIFNAPANAAYGDRVNKSGVGSYNFRGNVVERLLTHLLQRSQEEALALQHWDSPI